MCLCSARCPSLPTGLSPSPRIHLITAPPAPIAPSAPSTVPEGPGGKPMVKTELWEEEWSNSLSWPSNGLLPPLWEEAEEQEAGVEGMDQLDDKAILHQDLFLGLPLLEPEVDLMTLSPLKTEPPPSVAFVGAEPGPCTHSTQFIDGAAPYHQQHHQIAAGDVEYHQINSGDFSDYAWGEQQYAIPSGDDHYGPHHNFQQHQQYQAVQYMAPSRQTKPEGLEQDGMLITDISSSIPFDHHPPPVSSSTIFDPLSVDSSSWSAGGGGRSSAEDYYHRPADQSPEYSSLSQDEIYEEIQRECAEIEGRSSSGSPPSAGHRQKSKDIAAKQGSKKATTNLKRTAQTTQMKRKPYAGRASASSLESVSMEVTAPRKERKKELNRVAATRYREKKRKEREQEEEELHVLETRNAKLRADIAAVQTEMDYLKGLAAEIEVARRQGRRR